MRADTPHGVGVRPQLQAIADRAGADQNRRVAVNPVHAGSGLGEHSSRRAHLRDVRDVRERCGRFHFREPFAERPEPSASGEPQGARRVLDQSTDEVGVDRRIRGDLGHVAIAGHPKDPRAAGADPHCSVSSANGVPTQTEPNESTNSVGTPPPGFPLSNGMLVNRPARNLTM